MMILLLLYLSFASVEATMLCPIGFNETIIGRKEVCYQIKGPEVFTDKFENCPGNLFTQELYERLKLELPQPPAGVWSDYKTLYGGGPFVDRAYNEYLGAEPNYTRPHSADDELCLVMSPGAGFTAVSCDDKYERYCIIDAYNDVTNHGCEDTFKDIWDVQRFFSPTATCLKKVNIYSDVTWNQAQEMCEKEGGSLLNRGWIYSSYYATEYGCYNHYPLAIRINQTDVWYEDSYKDVTEIIPQSERHFEQGLELPIFNETGSHAYGVSMKCNEGPWIVSQDRTRGDIILCERSIQLRRINLSVYINSENKCILEVDGDLSSKDTLCYTDSSGIYPSLVSIKHETDIRYLIEYKRDGYYWCTHNDTRNFYTAESKKVLFIKEKNQTLNLYALKLNFARNYTSENITKWVKWVKIYDVSYVRSMTLKRRDRDGRSALLHLELMNPSMAEGRLWEDIKAGVQVEFVRPVYYCRNGTFKSEGTSDRSDCKVIECIGNFSEGVELRVISDKCPGNISVISSTNATPANQLQMKKAIDDLTTLTSSTEPIKEGDIDEPLNLPANQLQMKKAIDDLTTLISSTEPIKEGDIDQPLNLPANQLQMKKAIDDLTTLVSSTEPIKEGDIDEPLNSVSDLLADKEDVKLSSDLLYILDKLGARIDLAGLNESKTVKSNLALLVAEARADTPVRGLIIEQRTSDEFAENYFHIVRNNINTNDLNFNNNEVVIELPKTLMTAGRISFVVFRNDRAFQSSRGVSVVNSRVLSVKCIQNITKFHDGEFIDLHLSPLSKDTDHNSSRKCAFWNFLEDGSGSWSTEGCKLHRATAAGQLDTCRCDHLTHFAEILVPRTTFNDTNENILELISITGCSVSIFGLTLVGVTALLFRSWRRDFSNLIWLQLCISTFILSLAFLVTIFAQFDEPNVLCTLTGIILHFFVLSSFCWMLVAAVLSYRRLVTVYSRDPSHKLLRACVFAWGSPVVVVGILLSVTPHPYGIKFSDKTPTVAFCYPSELALWLAVFAPVAVMLLANLTLFVIIVRSVFASKSIQRHGSNTNEALRCAYISLFLMYLFGLPWVFGLFASDSIVMCYLFVLLSTFQGFVLFLFIVPGNKNTRDLWLGYIKSKRTKQVHITPITVSAKRTEGDGALGVNQALLVELNSKMSSFSQQSHKQSHFLSPSMFK